MRLRSLATAAAVIALAAPLTSCGFSYATERTYTPAGGANNREGVVDVLSAVVVSGTKGSGTFIASFSNNDGAEEQSVTAISGVSGSDGATIQAAEFEPVMVPADGLVNLAEPPADIVLTGEFTAGDVVPLAVDFGNGERIPLNVPVVANDFGYWEGMDAS
ncbi:hypothetical protein IEZ26_09225 [Nocardioides cavernae]|uniref:Copper chaperone PCu(A)C n=1 Tax=Nocardioides cavernae TaxID=1921566 RepID=A0ABR8N9I4_9ACTN|nr:hypothetical protein [Nocardioides cavernae]MBD3924797.1 hypothetical protein [Nocardioides cavernae]MBM7514829.1 hypothetical protein [Nocardioides cavernae]